MLHKSKFKSIQLCSESLFPLKKHKNKTENNTPPPPMVSFLEWLHLLKDGFIFVIYEGKRK